MIRTCLRNLWPCLESELYVVEEEDDQGHLVLQYVDPHEPLDASAIYVHVRFIRWLGRCWRVAIQPIEVETHTLH